MKLRNPLLIRTAAAGAALVLRGLTSTVRTRVRSFDGAVHPLDPDSRPCIYSFWHESLLAPCKLRTRIRVLISRSADGELIAQICRRIGVGVVRGSSSRGGAEALLELTRAAERKQSHLLFTPDGPRGPRRVVQPGMIFVASRTGLPILPVGIGFTRAWRASSWDHFATPLPFSTLTGIVGAPIHVPPELSTEGLAHYRRLVEQSMLEVTAAAERWAARRRRPMLFRSFVLRVRQGAFPKGVDHAANRIGRHVA